MLALMSSIWCAGYVLSFPHKEQTPFWFIFSQVNKVEHQGLVLQQSEWEAMGQIEGREEEPTEQQS